MSDIDPKAPKIRLLVLAKTLERVAEHVRAEILYVERGGDRVAGVTTNRTEINKVVAEMRKIAEELP